MDESSEGTNKAQQSIPDTYSKSDMKILRKYLSVIEKVLTSEAASDKEKKYEIRKLTTEVDIEKVKFSLNICNSICQILAVFDIEKENPLTILVYEQVSKFVYKVLASNEDIQVHKSLKNIISRVILALRQSHMASIEQDIVKVCEIYFIRQYFDCDSVIKPAVESLFKACFNENASKLLLSRLFKLKDSFMLYDLNNEESIIFRKLVIRGFTHSFFLTNPSGKKLLSYLWGIGDKLMIEILTTLKQQLIYLSKGLVNKYAEILFTAWNIIEDEACKQDFEYIVISPIVEYSIFLVNEKVRSHCIALIEQAFHKRKRINGVDSMLARMYSSIFTNLSCDNVEIRVNSLNVLRRAFPIRDPDSDPQEEELLLKQQLQSVRDLLFDDYVSVRVAALNTSSHILEFFWELVPNQIRKDILLDTIKLSKDASSSKVRAKAMNVLLPLLHLPHSKKTIEKLVSKLSPLIYDSAYKPRKLFIDILIVVQTECTINITDIVPLEDLIKVLTVEERCSLEISKLLKPYFYPNKSEEITSKHQFNRVLNLLNKHYFAGIKFMTHLPSLIGLEKVVKLIKMFGLWLKSLVDQLKSWVKGKSETKPQIDVILMRNALFGMNRLWDAVENTLEARETKVLSEVVSYNGFIKPFFSLVFHRKFFMLLPEEDKENLHTFIREDIKSVLLNIASKFSADNKLLESIQFNLSNYKASSFPDENKQSKLFTKEVKLSYSDYFDELTTFLSSELSCLFSWGKQEWVLSGVVDSLTLRKPKGTQGQLPLLRGIWILHFIVSKDIKFVKNSFSKSGHQKSFRSISELLLELIKSFIVDESDFDNFTFLGLLIETLVKLQIMVAVVYTIDLEKSKFVENVKQDSYTVKMPVYDSLIELLCTSKLGFQSARCALDVILAFENDFAQLRSQGVIFGGDNHTKLTEKYFSSNTQLKDSFTAILSEAICSSSKQTTQLEAVC